MRNTTGAQTEPLNEWATAQGGWIRIRLYANPNGGISVYALDGHELLPRTRNFTGPDAEQEARSYANGLWKSL